MAKHEIAQVDLEDEGICPDCGGPLEPEEAFAACVEIILAVIESLNQVDQMMALACSAAAFIGQFNPERNRKMVRKDFIMVMDENIHIEVEALRDEAQRPVITNDAPSTKH